MPPKTKMQQVVDLLTEQGLNNHQIQDFLARVKNASTEYLFQKLSEKMTSEDALKIDSVRDNGKVMKIIEQIYIKRLNSDPIQDSQEFIDNFADGFLTGYDYNQSLELAKNK